MNAPQQSSANLAAVAGLEKTKPKKDKPFGRGNDGRLESVEH